MIRCKLHVKRYDWTVWAYFAKTACDADEIMKNLLRIGLSRKDARTAFFNLKNGMQNTGLTYSGYAARESVLVIGLTSGPAEFLNSFVHELGHLSLQIAEAMGIDVMSEEVQYLSGGFAKRLYPIIRDFL